MKTNRKLLIVGGAVLIGMTAIALTFSNAMAQFAYLSGQWTSQYRCPSGQIYPLTLQIDQRGQQISAVKITDDPCVAAGQTAFSGYLTGNMGQLTCSYVYDPGPATSGNPGSVLEAVLLGVANALAPQSYAIGSAPGTLRVIDANSIEACTLLFVRSGVAPSLGFGSPQTGAWQGSPTYGSPAPWQNPGMTQTSGVPVTLQQPTFSHDVPNQRLIFRVNGQLQNAYGANATLAVLLEYEYGQTWVRIMGAGLDENHKDQQGHLTAWVNFSVQFNPYDLGVHSLEIPYAMMNMSGRQNPWDPPAQYKMRATAFVEINGTRSSYSPPVYFGYQQN